MKPIRNLEKNRSSENLSLEKRTQKKSMKQEETGITKIGKENGLVKLNEGLPEIRHTDSITPFPNIDQVESPSTNLIDDTTKQLRELMISVGKDMRSEENLFKSVQSVSAICNCAKNINALLRTKLDIFKSYKN